MLLWLALPVMKVATTSSLPIFLNQRRNRGHVRGLSVPKGTSPVNLGFSFGLWTVVTGSTVEVSSGANVQGDHWLCHQHFLTRQARIVSEDSSTVGNWNVVKCALTVATTRERVKWHFSEPNSELLLIKGMALSPVWPTAGMHPPAQWKKPRAIHSTQFTFGLGLIWPLYKFRPSQQAQIKGSLLGDHYSANCFRNVPST